MFTWREPIPGGSSLGASTRVSPTTRWATGSQFWGVLQRGALADPSANPGRGTHLPSPPSPSAARPGGPAQPPWAPPLRPLPRRGRQTNRVRARRGASFSSASERPGAIFSGRTGGLGPPRTLWLARLMEAGLTSIQMGVGCTSVAICACASPSYLRQVLGSQVFYYLAGAQLSRGDKKYTFEADGESEARATWPRQTARWAHTPAVTASSCCRSHRLFSMFQTWLSTAAPGI